MLQWCRRLADSSETPTGDEGVGDVCRPVCPSVHFLLLSVCPIGDVLRAAAVLAAVGRAKKQKLLLLSLRMRRSNISESPLDLQVESNQ